MKNNLFYISAFILLLFGVTSCKKYLAINSDPANNQNPSCSSIFPAMLGGLPGGIQYDARYLAKYIQNWNSNGSSDTWDLMGYVVGSDASGEIWKITYYSLGANLDYIIKKGLLNQQYDYVGAAYALKAYTFQLCTDYHGPIIFKEAFEANRLTFDYDDQATVYKGVDSLCRIALQYLNTPVPSSVPNKLSAADYVYNGDLSKWKKMVYATLAHNWHHTTNKSSYNADSVINFCNQSFASVNDDFDVPFDATKNDDANFFGPYRNNMSTFRQSNFIVKLLDGTILAGSNAVANRDPRLPHMISSSQDKDANGNVVYRGVDPGVGDPNTTSTTGTNALKRVPTLWGDSTYTNPSSGSFAISGKYLFQNKAVLPVMTYAELLFIKAEAEFRKGLKAAAYTDYKAAIQAHFDFINRSYSGVKGDVSLYNGTSISQTAINTYLAGPSVKQSSAVLTIGDIMLQKYIALWGWGFEETWVDLRRFHYTDLDPSTGAQVYSGFSLPVKFYVDNGGLPAYRVRPRYNSEFIWNTPALYAIGCLDAPNASGNYIPTYHTKECWFSQP